LDATMKFQDSLAHGFHYPNLTFLLDET
jgi:hypothetical protein